ncbi:MAG: HAD-IC family P-type ATPase, partial [Clostridia bacterium]|nr:HAD-IC family P-type ATPase [Clostridia bacterium]
MKQSYTQSTKEVFKQLATSEKGLTATEAQNRLTKYGKNQLADIKKKSWASRFFAQFKDVMIILLLVSAVISLVFGIIENKGATEFIDTIIILFIVVLNAVLGVVQESKAENAMDSLKNMSQPYSKVLRDNQVVFVKTSELVVGDVVLLEAGDVVPADLRFIETVSLKCDESMLTGESIPVSKNADLVLDEKTALGDRRNMGFSSSVVTYGRGKGIVVATGQDTEIGKIAGMLNRNPDKENTTLQNSLNKFAQVITVCVLVIAFVIFMIDLFITKQHWTESLITAIAIAVAAIPESLMIVVTIILSMGVTKLAKQNVIIRRLHAVETLGCCEVICSDKTGTITQNKMTVRKVFFNNQEYDLKHIDKNQISQMLEGMVLCNDAKIQADTLIGDPTETALLECAQKFGYQKAALDEVWQRVNEIPFDSNRKLMSTVNVKNNEYKQFTKGAFDEIIKRCTQINDNGTIRKITNEDIKSLKEANTTLCSQALRVLGFAVRDCQNKDDIKEAALTFVGMTGMIDPPRPEVYHALKKCKRAGMQAIMITGDHKDTA